MKKFAISAAVAAVAMVAGASAHAQVPPPTVTATFDVNLTLTPKCVVATASGGASTAAVPNIGIAYTAFQAGPGTGSTNFFVRCSTSLGYSVALDLFNNITDGLTGLSYNLALKTTDTGDAATPVGVLTGQLGLAAGTQYWVQAYVPANQGGTTSLETDNKTRTITVTY
jgi:opacity protein-like surface antigen